MTGADRQAVEPYVIRLRETGGGIGGTDGDTFGYGLSFDDYEKPLPGFMFTSDDGDVQVVGAFHSPEAARIEFTNAVLRFAVNGGADQEQTFPASGVVCLAGSPTLRMRVAACVVGRDKPSAARAAIMDRMPTR